MLTQNAGNQNCYREENPPVKKNQMGDRGWAISLRGRFKGGGTPKNWCKG